MQGVRKFLMMAVLGLAATAAVMPAHAQDDKRISVNVPFDFTLGKTTLRSGQYRVEVQPSGVVMFTNLDGHLRRFAVLSPGGKVADRSEPYLVFTKYGKDAFLSRVVFSANNNYDLPKTDRERELIASTLSGHEMAMVIQPAQ